MDLINTENLSFRYPDAQQTFKFPDIQLSKKEKIFCLEEILAREKQP
jgi:hypothetical protein